jgi:hypothetical protein
MTMLAFISFLLSAVPKLLELMSKLVAYAHDRELISLGETKAIAAALKKLSDVVEIARQVEADAEKKHADDPTDSAFDRDFERKD